VTVLAICDGSSNETLPRVIGFVTIEISSPSIVSSPVVSRTGGAVGDEANDRKQHDFSQLRAKSTYAGLVQAKLIPKTISLLQMVIGSTSLNSPQGGREGASVGNDAVGVAVGDDVVGVTVGDTLMNTVGDTLMNTVGDDVVGDEDISGEIVGDLVR